MKVVKPVAITDAQFVSSTAPETDCPAYVADTNYAVGARVIYLHQIFESVQTPNTGNAPDATPLYWAVVGPTNRWAMFDTEINTQTAIASPLTVVIKPGYVNSLALFGLEGATLDVTVRDGLAGPIVYTATRSLDGTVISDYYQYFFEPSVQLAGVVLTDLPPYGNAHITVSITGGGTVKCGILIAGTVYDLGGTQFGVRTGIIDFSKKETNTTTGTTKFKKGKYSKPLSAQLFVENGQLNKVNQVLDSLRATPCAWISTDEPGYELITVFGYYGDFSIEVTYATTSYCNLEIIGLT